VTNKFVRYEVGPNVDLAQLVGTLEQSLAWQYHVIQVEASIAGITLPSFQDLKDRAANAINRVLPPVHIKKPW
jgi:hypothetical protein